MNIQSMKDSHAGQLQTLLKAVEQYRRILDLLMEQARLRRLELVQIACQMDLENDPAILRDLQQDLRETEADRLDAQKRLEELSAILRKLPVPVETA